MATLDVQLRWVWLIHACLLLCADARCCCGMQGECLKQGLDVQEVLNCVFTVNTGEGVAPWGA
jgi:hypothetical protein